MIKWIAFLSKSDDLLLRFRENTPSFNFSCRSRELLYDSADNTYIRMGLEYLQLPFTPIRSADIVRIHTSNKFVLTFFDPDV